MLSAFASALIVFAMVVLLRQLRLQLLLRLEAVRLLSDAHAETERMLSAQCVVEKTNASHMIGMSDDEAKA